MTTSSQVIGFHYIVRNKPYDLKGEIIPVQYVAVDEGYPFLSVFQASAKLFQTTEQAKKFRLQCEDSNVNSSVDYAQRSSWELVKVTLVLEQVL